MNENTILAHYRILRPLGKGGMGEVYLALDTKLDRQVALKVLPEAVSRDPERLARFRREAKAAAGLQHPNIATVYALEEATPDDNGNAAPSSSPIHFITMEYVDGVSLADCIPADGMDVGDPNAVGRTQGSPLHFFDVFIPLADALAHAHENRRVHRDLKPANLMIAKDGTPKILDFGLAQIFRIPHSAFRIPDEVDTQTETKSIDPAELNKPVHPPSDPSAMAQGPKLMGTPAYMSPEQAQMQETDHRTDIFSFGVVMYEALTGRKPFEGESRQSLLGRIINDTPEPITAINPVTPYLLWHLIDRSLRKHRDQRLQTARELHTDLCGIRKEIESGTNLVDASNPSIRQSVNPSIPLRPVYAVVVALLLAAVTATAAWFLKADPPVEPRLRRFALPIEATVTIFDSPVLSPDGTMIVYTRGSGSNSRLWIRDLDRTEPRELPITSGGMRPFFSPDSRYIGYFGLAGLYTISKDGGPASPVCNLPANAFPRGAVWTPDGRIIYGMNEGLQDPAGGSLYVVSARGGTPERFLAPDTTAGERGVIYPMLLPDGKTLVASITLRDGTGTLSAVSGGRRIELVRHAGDVLAYPAYAATGHLVYQRGFQADRSVSSSVWGILFDAENTSPTEEPFLIADKAIHPSVSSDGSLLYSAPPTTALGRNRLVWVDRSGRITGTIGQEQTGLQGPALSPDEDRVAVSALDQNSYDIWAHDVSRGTMQRLTFDPFREAYPVWSHDGTRLAFYSFKRDSYDSYVIPADGSSGAEPLITGADVDVVMDWSSDGRYVLYQSLRFGGWDLLYLSGDEARVQLTDTPYGEYYPQFSPDGKYVAYTSDVSGRTDVYVTRFPSGQGKWQVSVDGGNLPRWSRKGDELFFISGNTLMAVDVHPGASFNTGIPVALFSSDNVVPPLQITEDIGYDVSHDGRFVMVQQMEVGEQGAPVITLVQNWAREFER